MRTEGVERINGRVTGSGSLDVARYGRLLTARVGRGAQGRVGLRRVGTT